MKRLVSAALFVLLLVLIVPVQPLAHAQASAQSQVTSQYILNRYGYAIVNETVRFTNNGTTAIIVPNVSVGLGNLSSEVVSDNLTGSGFKLGFGIAAGGPYAILGRAVAGRWGQHELQPEGIDRRCGLDCHQREPGSSGAY